MRKTRPRTFFGWWVVLASAIGLLLGPVPILIFSFGVFLKPLTAEFHASRATISLALTLHNSVTAFGVLFAGWLVDRFGARKIILPAMVMTGLLLLSSFFCSARIWQLYLFFAAAGLVGSGMAPVPFANVISHWFDRRRGLALGTMFLGVASGAIVMPSVAQRLVDAFGWRFAYGAIGAAILLITVPLMFLLLKDGPEQMGLLPDGASLAAAATKPVRIHQGVSLREAWNTPTLWLLLSIFVVVSASMHACFLHLHAILTDRGISPATAAMASSLFGSGILVGRFASGYLLDRVFAPRLGAIIFGFAAAGIVLLGATRSHQLAFEAALIIGLGWGTEGDVKAYLIGRYFGLRSFGAIYGFIFAGFLLAGGLGAYLMGAGYDATHSYSLGLTASCIGVLIAAVLMMLLGPYRYGVEPMIEAGQESNMITAQSPVRP